MNSDEIQSDVTKAVLMGFSLWGGASAATSGANAQALAAAAGILASLIYGFYLHWNMRKVPEKAVVTSSAPTVAEAKAISAPAEAVAAAK